MKSSSSSEHDEQDRKIIRLLENLGTSDAEYPPDLLAARRAAFLAQRAQLAEREESRPAETAGELPAGEEETVKLLQSLRTVQAQYPAELLAARRAAFIARVDGLAQAQAGDELSPGGQEMVRLLGRLKSAPLDYPPALLAARRAAFLRQAAGVGRLSLWDRLRGSLRRTFPSATDDPAAPPGGFTRLSLVIASLLLAVFLGSLWFSRVEPSLRPPPSQTAAPTRSLPTMSGGVTLTICMPEDRTPACSPKELTPEQDLANVDNGAARPAVSREGRTAAHVNDGRQGASWVSQSPGSWIKIDLGQVASINTVSLQKGSPGFLNEDNLGQFVIAVALSDVYSDGDSLNDLVEYAQVFSSAEAGFSGAVSATGTILTHFPSTRARYVKITFEQAGAAIQEVGVFALPPPGAVEEVTSTLPVDLPTITPTGTPLSIVPPTFVSPATALASSTSIIFPANTLPPAATSTAAPASTDTQPALPTGTQTPADTATPVPTDPLPSETSLPPPTVAPPTAVPPTVAPPPAGDPIVVTGSGQNLTFTCSGNEAVVHGHDNIVTLLGACSSITVTGNGNLVFYESGSPVIVNRGRDNVITRR